MYQFCVGAAKGVLSPFVLQEIIMEALQRLNPAHIHAHLRTPAFHQLVQRCQQAYLQVRRSHSCFHKGLDGQTPVQFDLQQNQPTRISKRIILVYTAVGLIRPFSSNL